MLEKHFNIIGCPSDLGANIKGSLMGPAAIRTAGLVEKMRALGFGVEDFGDVTIPERNAIDPDNVVEAIAKINVLLKQKVLASFASGAVPITLGGDHSLSIGSLAACAEHFHSSRIGLVWIDTHADINTPESSPTGNIHGMPISVLLGKGHALLTEIFSNRTTILPENIALVGLRDIDAHEKDILKASGVRYYTMRDIDELGIQKVMSEIYQMIVKKVDGIHVSFDMDVMDPLQVPGVSTPVPGGLSIREAHLALEMLSETDKIVSADVVELNPYHDDRGRSARTAVDLIGSLMGKRII